MSCPPGNGGVTLCKRVPIVCVNQVSKKEKDTFKGKLAQEEEGKSMSVKIGEWIKEYIR